MDRRTAKTNMNDSVKHTPKRVTSNEYSVASPYVSYKDIAAKKGVARAPHRTLNEAVEEKRKELKKELDRELKIEMMKERKRAEKYANAEPVYIDTNPNFKQNRTETVDMIYIDDDGEQQEINQVVQSGISGDNIFVIHSKEDYLNVMKYSKAIIFYGSTYCKICTELKSLYQRIAARYGNIMKMAYTNVDEIGMDLSPLPQIVTYINGKQRAMLEGGNVDKFRSIIKDLKDVEI